MNARIAIRDRDDFEMLDQRLDAFGARQQRRNDDDGLGFLGHALESSSRGSGSGCTRRLDELLHERDRELAGGNQEQQRRRGEHRGRCAGEPRVAQRRRHEQRRGQSAIAPRYTSVACARTSRAQARLQLRAITEIELEAGAAAADQVIADVRGGARA